MAVKMRLKRMGKKKNPIYELLLQTQDLQEMEETSTK